MTSNYSDIFNRFYSEVDAYDLLSLNDVDLLEMETDWLHSVVANPYVRNLFSEFSMDDEIQLITYELKYSIDEAADREFVISLFTLGMKIAWLQPKVDSILNTAPTIGGKEEKKLLDNHKYNIDRLKTLKTEQKKLIRDYGFMNNSYVNGD